MVTHSSRKDHECKLCGASFRTKGSLIRHHRRHTGEPAWGTPASWQGLGEAMAPDLPSPPEVDSVLATDERPYKCAKCGKSFRESGALTRHLKSLTPCTEKIRFSMSKDVVVSKEDVPAGQRGESSLSWPWSCPVQGIFFKDSLGSALKDLVPPPWGLLHQHQRQGSPWRRRL